jgi:hypothetical protein
VQDSILADPTRSAVINLIDIKYWYYQADGTTYAPAGGLSLAPRQHARLLNPKPTSFDQVYRAVHEYRTKYPDKAVIYSADNYATYGWAVFMAGGSLANTPKIDDPKFMSDATIMKPIELLGKPLGQWALGDPEKGYIVYNTSLKPVLLTIAKTMVYDIKWIDPKDGHVIRQDKNINADQFDLVKPPQPGPVIMWASRK